MNIRACRGVVVLVVLAAAVSPRPVAGQESTLGTIVAGVAGELTAKPWAPPIGPAPRTASGKPDLSGVWDHAYVPDMSVSNAQTPSLQKASGPLPYTPAGLDNLERYDPEKDGDYTGMCMPFGLTRSMNAPYPIQILQTDTTVAFLFEQNNWFHVVPIKPAHVVDDNPTWFGDSIARWDGDTLVVDTVDFNGYTRLDTRGNPHSDRLHLVQTFRRVDAGHLAYTVTIDDPVYYTKPWTNERTWSLAKGGLLEYSCEENNKSLWEGRIKIWVPPGTEQPRIQKQP
jgi:hypothetical protein